MPLPSIAAFEEPLARLTTQTPSNPDAFEAHVAISEKSIAVGASQQTTDAVRAVRMKAVALWWPRGPLTFASFVTRLSKELSSLSHLSDERVTLVVLALFAQLRPRFGRSVDVLNRMLTHVNKVDITQFYICPELGSVPDYDLDVGSFRLGPLDLTKLENRCRRARSDFFQRYGTTLTNRFAVERRVFQQHAIAWGLVFEDLGRTYTPDEYYVIDEYFGSIAELLHAEFWRVLRDEQHLLVAAGAPYVDERIFQQIPLSQFVTVFLNLGPKRQGWVSPGTRCVVLELAKTDRVIPHIVALLEAHGVSTPTRPVQPTVDAYARLLSRAVRHRLDHASNEAFLHFVIALDLLFGEDGKSTKSIARRAAVLVMRHLGLSFQKAVERISELYNARSRYVHAGADVASELIIEAESICREILFCMLRRRTYVGAGSADDLVTSWVKQLDFVASAVEAGKTVLLEEWTASGIFVAVSS